MSERADVIVMGIGTCGEDLSLRLARAGLDVVGIEPNLIGGECAYWACIPSKMMIRASNLLAEARRIEGFAGHAEVTPDWSFVAERIRTGATGNWDDSYAVQRFEGAGGRLVRGYGRLSGPRCVTVGDEEYTAEQAIVIATGSQPIIPPIPGLDGIDYWTTHDAIQADPLPASLVILGGGAVGCELGQVFARFGVEVTIVDGEERLLSHEEPEASALITQTFEAEGISVRSGARVVSAEQRPEGTTLILDDGRTCSGERLLIATGRRPDASALGLETLGVEATGSFVPVDEWLRVSDGVWSIGDATGKGMLTNVAMYQASIVVAQILGNETPPADYRAHPRVTFTDPEVGSVGMTEAQAHETGIEVDVVTKTGPTFRGWIHGPGGEGVIKLIVDRNEGVLIGATAVSQHGGEVLGMLATAVHARVPVQTLNHMIYGFPTFTGGVGEAIGAHARGLVTVLDPDASPLFTD